MKRVKRFSGWLIAVSAFPAITTAFWLTEGGPPREIILAIVVMHYAFLALVGVVCLAVWLMTSD